jgi:hypothetical protein
LAGFFHERFAGLISRLRHFGNVMPYRLGLVILIVSMIGLSYAKAANLTKNDTQEGGEVLLKGDIAQGDADSLESIVRAAQESSFPVNTLRLDSPGGNLVGGIALARFVRRHPELSIKIDAGAMCASACFLAFSAGASKYASYNSFVGVHAVADDFGKVTEETEAATQTMARISEELGVPAEITAKMIATSPDEIVWLKPDELQSMGVVMLGKPLQSPDSADVTTSIAALDAPHLSSLTATASEAADRGDYATAIRLWRQLAEKGHAASEYNLGEMYYAGKGVAQDYGAAVRWYQRAAERGIPEAQLDVGVAYALGRGVPRDLEKAYMWFSIAAITYPTDKERAEAEKARNLISAHMSSDEIAAAKKLTGGRARSR